MNIVRERALVGWFKGRNTVDQIRAANDDISCPLLTHCVSALKSANKIGSYGFASLPSYKFFYKSKSVIKGPCDQSVLCSKCPVFIVYCVQRAV